MGGLTLLEKKFSTKSKANNSVADGRLKPPASNSFLTGQARIIIISLFATLACVGIIKAATTIGNNIITGGTLDVTGNSVFSTASSTGIVKFGQINSDTGSINFGDENLYTTGNIGIGTSSPYAKLSVVGEIVGSYFTATSTTATSTIYGGLNITETDNSAFTVGTTSDRYIVRINTDYNQNDSYKLSSIYIMPPDHISNPIISVVAPNNTNPFASKGALTTVLDIDSINHGNALFYSERGNDDPATHSLVALSGVAVRDYTGADDPITMPWNYGVWGEYYHSQGNLNSLGSYNPAAGVYGHLTMTGSATKSLQDGAGVKAGLSVDNTASNSTLTDGAAFWAINNTRSAGTLTNSYGLVVNEQTGGTNNYGIWLNGDTGTTTDDLGSSVVFGAGRDAAIGYDGTDLIINTDIVGSGVLSLFMNDVNPNGAVTPTRKTKIFTQDRALNDDTNGSCESNGSDCIILPAPTTSGLVWITTGTASGVALYRINGTGVQRNELEDYATIFDTNIASCNGSGVTFCIFDIANPADSVAIINDTGAADDVNVMMLYD